MTTDPALSETIWREVLDRHLARLTAAVLAYRQESPAAPWPRPWVERACDVVRRRFRTEFDEDPETLKGQLVGEEATFLWFLRHLTRFAEESPPLRFTPGGPARRCEPDRAEASIELVRPLPRGIAELVDRQIPGNAQWEAAGRLPDAMNRLVVKYCILLQEEGETPKGRLHDRAFWKAFQRPDGSPLAGKNDPALDSLFRKALNRWLVQIGDPSARP